MTGPASFPPPRSRDLDPSTALELLRDGEMEIIGRLLGLDEQRAVGTVTRRCPDPEPDIVAACVYKPTIGERPLDDFPDGTLSHREVAAFLVSEAIGWKIVPPTVYATGRSAAGWSSCGSTSTRRSTRCSSSIEAIRRLRRMAVFDAAINNTDRKARPPAAGARRARLRRGPRGVLLARCRSCERCSGTGAASRSRRRRSRCWRGSARASAACWVMRCASHLAPHEVAAMVRRVERLLKTGRFPQPDPRRPALPWPPV